MAAVDFSRITVVESPGRSYVPKPTEMMLQQFEEAHSFQLPESYRQFALQFGAGELAGHYRIYAPVEGGMKVKRRADIETFNASAHHGPRLADYKQPEKTTNFICFASDVGGGWYAWDTKDVRKKRLHEYAITYLDKTDMEVVAATFAEFVDKCCRRSLWGTTEAEEDWTFGRFEVRKGE